MKLFGLLRPARGSFAGSLWCCAFSSAHTHSVSSTTVSGLTCAVAAALPTRILLENVQSFTSLGLDATLHWTPELSSWNLVFSRTEECE